MATLKASRTSLPKETEDMSSRMARIRHFGFGISAICVVATTSIRLHTEIIDVGITTIGRSYGFAACPELMRAQRYGHFPKPKRPAHPKDCSVMTYRGHAVLRTLIRCNFSPTETTGGQYIYSGSADGRIHVSKDCSCPSRYNQRAILLIDLVTGWSSRSSLRSFANPANDIRSIRP